MITAKLVGGTLAGFLAMMVAGQPMVSSGAEKYKPTTHSEKSEKSMKVHSHAGRVTQVDAKKMEFTLTTAPVKPGESKPKHIKFHWDEKTRFMKDGKSATADQLKTGVPVTVNYKTYLTKHIATEVTFSEKKEATASTR